MNDILRKHAMADRFLFLMEDFKSIDKNTLLLIRTSHLEELGIMLKELHDRLQEIKEQDPTLGKVIDAKTNARAHKK